MICLVTAVNDTDSLESKFAVWNKALVADPDVLVSLFLQGKCTLPWSNCMSYAAANVGKGGRLP